MQALRKRIWSFQFDRVPSWLLSSSSLTSRHCNKGSSLAPKSYSWYNYAAFGSPIHGSSAGEFDPREKPRRPNYAQESVPSLLYTGVRFVNGSDRWRGQINVKRDPDKGCTRQNKWILTTSMHLSETEAAAEVASLRYIATKLKIVSSRPFEEIALTTATKKELDKFAERGIEGLKDFIARQRNLSAKWSRKFIDGAIGVGYAPHFGRYRLRFQRRATGHIIDEIRYFRSFVGAAKCYDRFSYIYDRVFRIESLRPRLFNIGISKEEKAYLDTFHSWEDFILDDRRRHGYYKMSDKKLRKLELFSSSGSTFNSRGSTSGMGQHKFSRMGLTPNMESFVGVFDVSHALKNTMQDGASGAEGAPLVTMGDAMLEATKSAKERTLDTIIMKLRSGNTLFAGEPLLPRCGDLLIAPRRTIVAGTALASSYPRPLLGPPSGGQHQASTPEPNSLWLPLTLLIGYQHRHNGQSLFCVHVDAPRLSVMRMHPVLLWVSPEISWLLPPHVVAESLLPTHIKGGFIAINRDTAWEWRDYCILKLTEAELTDKLQDLYLELSEAMIRLKATGRVGDPLVRWDVANSMDLIIPHSVDNWKQLEQ